MKTFPSFPVGARVPDTPHAVCCSLPTIRDVIGYEEHDPEIRKHIISGYPRFVEHAFLRALIEYIRVELDLTGQNISLTPSKRSAEELIAFLKCRRAVIREWNGIFVVALPARDDLAQGARLFLQHTGCGLSSRQAEDLLHGAGLVPKPRSESKPEKNPEQTIRRVLLDACPGAGADFLLLSRSGMNAFYATFNAARRIQRPRGKTIWVQLGWLYLDTIRILEKFLAPEERCITIPDATDTASLERIFSRDGARIAGVITETPTNPLLQTADLARIRALCDRDGSLLFVDPTLASFYNIDVFPYADVVLHSLTKYFGHCGDVMMGAAVFNPRNNAISAEWLKLAREGHEAPYRRDALRLAAQIKRARDTVETINHNTFAVADFLRQHPRVKRVHWAYGENTAEGYGKLARGPDRPGGILTIDLDMPLSDFYDNAPFVKGPSFGTNFTMMCPFMYLAHYDLVSTQEGRRHLLDHGIDPDLVRVSIGTEPTAEIIKGFQLALGD